MRANNGNALPMHPILVALSIVIADKEDLSRITRDHPGRLRHKFYDASANFSADISDLLPPSEDRWWEVLGKPGLLRSPCCPPYNLTMKSRIGSQDTRYRSHVTTAVTATATTATTVSSNFAARGHGGCDSAAGPTRDDFSTARPTRGGGQRCANGSG